MFFFSSHHDDSAVRGYSKGNNFRKFETGAFKNLPALKEILISSETLEEIETETFDNLPSLTILDLNHQQLTVLPTRFVSG